MACGIGLDGLLSSLWTCGAPEGVAVAAVKLPGFLDAGKLQGQEPEAKHGQGGPAEFARLNRVSRA